jgi:uncharacterized protein YqhQ
MGSARPYIGGQAVLEGVMMRAPASFAVVVRRRDGALHVRERAMPEGAAGIGRWPLLRGLVSLVESLRLGSEALRFSAERMEEDMNAAAGPGVGLLGALGLVLVAMVTRDDGGSSVGGPPSRGSKLGTWLMLAFAIAFFVALPQGAAAGINRLLHLGLEVQSGRFQAMTGALKLVIVVGYLVAIRRIPDIRRVFQYHGAEHKTISAYEAGEALTVESARAKTTLHPRCGTTFLVMVALVSMLVFAAVGMLLPRIHTGSPLADNAIFFLEKLPFLPVLVALTFEVQRFFAKYCVRGPLRLLLWPGFWVQKITTAEPDDEQLEVALASLRATLFRQERASGAALATNDVVFPGYAAFVAAESLRPPARAA